MKKQKAVFSKICLPCLSALAWRRVTEVPSTVTKTFYFSFFEQTDLNMNGKFRWVAG